MSDRRTKYREIIIVSPTLTTQRNLKRFFRGQSVSGFRTYDSFSSLCQDLPKSAEPQLGA